ncbi:biotin carboxyl carrier protein of acetyl-CoA carboxylase, chloroplastic-like protein [Cinnamomum micranthum f. kanehirae]|uniref:Biotin carboxyl carrier protein of acetyl-CoA carboxylase n=1 Tax=Cinnamomum micranthum f. kanehirae TaxID=337451 RepID=A0A443NXE2_9MAGN|nr:biotin carboxyl carrier protein of acetyl-CoA carboxylase, chloroplastic-like protein [Cinnamomum micranthum f. kanehirae]
MELKLKQRDCELIIRKKEAFPQPTTAPMVMMQPPSAPMLPSQPAPVQTATRPSASAPASTAPPALPAPAKSSKSSHPPLKCPMAGTFYRCRAPGEPPFVKVGDKVQKGQVICIIEAMKLMNEIEADQSGTIVEIPAEDGKPVSVDTIIFSVGKSTVKLKHSSFEEAKDKGSNSQIDLFNGLFHVSVSRPKGYQILL